MLGHFADVDSLRMSASRQKRPSAGYGTYQRLVRAASTRDEAAQCGRGVEMDVGDVVETCAPYPSQHCTVCGFRDWTGASGFTARLVELDVVLFRRRIDVA
jgi:hypothetical protein